MEQPLRIEVLGELRVLSPRGDPIELPASRKTKALLSYLALTRRPQFREHLCDLLWDSTDDPRGGLRWSLSRLRAALDDDHLKRVESDRRTIGLAKDGCRTDLEDAEAAIGGASQPPLDDLRRGAALFRGELLDGLDLLESFRFHTWCAGQRENARTLRIRALTALIDRVPDSEEALQFAHELVSVDPLSEDAQAQVIRLLVQMSRHRDAEAQADSYRRILEIELGQVPADVATRLRKLVHSDAAPRVVRPEVPERLERVAALPLVGRETELARLEAWLKASDAPPMALIAGDPGAGKTRLMNEAIGTAGRGVTVIRGRAYRAENVRPLGPWRDALSDVTGAPSVFSSTADVTSERQQRTQLFDELLALISAQVAVGSRLLISLDDLQWLDEASAAFLHFLVRCRPDRVRILATVRSAETIDNQAVAEALESLSREDALAELALEPLPASAIAELCAAVDETIDAEQVTTRSEGNPFLATEIARALARGETELPENTLHLVEGRLRALSEPARELLPWAAALGRTFNVDVLETVTGLDAVALLERVGELEERGVFEPRETSAYDFVHDFVRDAAYRELSAPRRRILHRSIARSLDRWDGDETAFSAIELLRHAELGSEPAIACRAAVAAAKDALSVSGWLDACALADRGLQHVDSLDAVQRVTRVLELLDSRIAAELLLERNHPEHVPKLLSEAIETAKTAQQKTYALHLRSQMHWTQGHGESAATDIVAAADASRLADPETTALQIANSARCLLHVERDVDKARRLLEEARRAQDGKDLRDVELAWAEALMARWDGDLGSAAKHLYRAIELAKEAGSHWRESSCLASLIQVTSEAGDLDKVEELSRGGLLSDEADGEPLKSPFVQALAGLADFGRDPTSTERLDGAIETLRSRRAHPQLCYVQAEAARIRAERGDLDRAFDAATEAAALAEAGRRLAPRIDALVTLAWVHSRRGSTDQAKETLERAESLVDKPDAVTSRVRARMMEVARSVRGA